MKKIDCFTSRHEIFKDMLKSIFTRADLKYEYVDSEGVWRVSIGNGGDLVSDCKKSYSSEYKNKFNEIFKLCLLDENVEIHCFHNKKEIAFSRENIISNVTKYFNELGLKIYDPFIIGSEKRLFTKLLYKYIVQILDAIFDVDYPVTEMERKSVGDDYIKASFEKRVSKLKRQAEKSDITNLIYSNATKNDIDIIFDPDYKEGDYNYAICIPLYDRRFDIFGNFMIMTDISYIDKEPAERWYSIDGYYQKIEREVFTYCDFNSEEGRKELYQQKWVHMISGFEKYPFTKNSPFKPQRYRKEIKQFKVIDCDAYCYQLPHYVYFVTKLSKEELRKKYRSIFDNPSLIRYMEDKAIKILKERYDITEEKYSVIMLENVVSVLDCLSKIDAKTFFDFHMELKEYIDNFFDMFLNLNGIFSFLRSHVVYDKQAIIIFIYSVSTIIDNLCHYIENLTTANTTSISEDYTSTLRLDNAIMIKNSLSTEKICFYADKIKTFLESGKLSEFIELYREYYYVREDILLPLKNVIDNSNYSSLRSLIHNPVDEHKMSFVPFEFLKSELECLYEILSKIGHTSDLSNESVS